jgi:hypothetical protein
MTIDSMTKSYCFLYGPRGPGFGSASIISAISSKVHTRSVSPACIAWVTRKECLFFAFDLLFLNGKDLGMQALIER